MSAPPFFFAGVAKFVTGIMKSYRVEWKEPILCGGGSEEGAWKNLSWALKEHLGERGERREGSAP